MQRCDEANRVEFGELVGKVLVGLDRLEDIYGDVLVFKTSDGDEYMQTHDQDCCEHVRIEDICGELSDLIGQPILLAEEVASKDEDAENRETLARWTFYKLATNRGAVTIRWYGESNGYYSVDVDFLKKV